MLSEYLKDLGLSWKNTDEFIGHIAVSLSRLPRFCGHTERFYSVAEHLVLCSRVCEREPMAALIHDVGEVLTGDIPSPIKHQMKGMPEVFERNALLDFMMQTAIRCPVDSPCVHESDLRVLASEKAQLFPNASEWEQLKGVSPANVLIECWEDSFAAANWIARFQELK